MFKVALAGNPNVGKTSLFNRLTKSGERVGNFPGVTVGKREKAARGGNFTVTDLPGLYSLTVYSPEENIARDEILSGKYDVTVCVCDANNLKRTLYLALQLIEAGQNVIIAVNMIDELKKGVTVDCALLSKTLGVRVEAVSAKKAKTCLNLISVIDEALKNRRTCPRLSYLEKLPISEVISICGCCVSGLNRDYTAVKLLEKDGYVAEKLGLKQSALSAVEKLGVSDTIPAELRHSFLRELCSSAVKGRNSSFKFGFLDKILLNPKFSLPIFAAVMLCIFFLTFGFLGKFFSDLTEFIFNAAIFYPVSAVMKSQPEWFYRLITEGVLISFISVARFMPQIALLFFFLSLLEDSGYIARVAFMTDGVFGKIGLSGRSVFTMLMGFGCTATAVMTAKSIDDENVRIKTVMMTPFMSCSAKLPVYSAVAAAFFGGGEFAVIFSLYLLGVAAAVFSAVVSQKIAAKDTKAFIMEMPPFRLPTLERVSQLTFNNIKSFLLRVGTVIVTLNVFVWIMSNFSFLGEYTANGGISMTETAGSIIAPLLYPLGLGNWKAAAAFLSGLIAKEGVIAAIEGLGGLSEIIGGSYTAATAAAFLTFTLFYTPCVAALTSISREIGIKYAVLSGVFQFVFAYAAAAVIRLVFVAFTLFLPFAFLAAAALLAAFIIIKKAKTRSGKTKSAVFARADVATKDK